MTNNLHIEKLHSEDKDYINIIAGWYLDQWSIPKETTLNRLSNVPSEDVLFHLVLMDGNNLIASGGLHNKVGLFREHPGFEEFKPWAAMLYTEENRRNNGLGQMLLSKIEHGAIEAGFKKIYLYTYTAEPLYKRSGWTTFDRVLYKGHNNAIMEKALGN